MLMAISFPDTVSSATQFSNAAARPNAASSAKSLAISAGHECSVCPEQKSDQPTNEDFEAVLAWMISGIVPSVQPPTVAEATNSDVTSDTAETQVGENTNSFGLRQATRQTGTASLQGIASGPSQGAWNNPDAFTTGVPVELGSPQPSTPSGVTAETYLKSTAPFRSDESLNGVAAPMRSESGPISSDPEPDYDLEFLPSDAPFSSPAVRDMAAMPQAQTTAFSTPVETDFARSATPEALSQDAIDALERIGRLPGSVISQAPLSAFLENTPIVSASQVHASSASTVPVAVSAVDAKLVSAVPSTELPISATMSSVLTESSGLKSPVPASVQATAVLPVATPSVAATPNATTSVPVLPVIDASVTITPVTATSEKDVTGSRKSSIVVTSDQVLASNSKSGFQASSVPVASKNIELMTKPVRGRTSFASALPVSDNPAFPLGHEPHAAALPSYDAVRSDMVQPNAAHTLPDLATSISGEMRQPLSNQVSQAIMEHIERNGVRSHDTLSVRLDPPELGEMTIELSKTLEGLAVRVTAREAVTMDMLFARGQEIESHLRGQQMNLKSLEFLRADMSGNQFSQGQQHNEGSRRSENLMNPVRRGSRSSIPTNTNVGRITTPDSTYGLSFRA